MIKRSLIGLLSAAMIAGSLGGMPVTAYAAEECIEEEILTEEVFTEEDIEEEEAFEDEESLIDEDLVEETLTEDFSEETENIEEIEETETTEDIEAQPKEAAALAENSANSGTCGDDLTWKLNKTTLTIKGTGNMYDYSGQNPAPWSGKEVEKVVFGKNVNSIGKYAFGGCTTLRELNFEGGRPGICIIEGQESFAGVKSGIVVKYDGSIRDWKEYTTGKDLGMGNAIPILKPHYPKKNCKVTFNVNLGDGIKYNFPTQIVKCGGHAKKPDESVLKLGKWDIPYWLFKYTKDGKSAWTYHMDFEREVITEDIEVQLGICWDEKESWGDIPEVIRSFMKFDSVKDVPQGIWIVGSDQYEGETFTADGKAKKLCRLLVFKGTKLLDEGKDYSLKYSNNVKAGEAVIKVSFKGSYSKEKSAEYRFNIAPGVTVTSLKKVSFAEQNSGSPKLKAEVYTGSAVNKAFILTDNTDKNAEGKVLNGIAAENYVKLSDKEKLNYDYIYSYEKNVNKGKAKLIICGVSGYKGKITKTFAIKAADISQEGSPVTVKLPNKSYPLVKGGVKPEPVVTFKVGGKTETLTKGKDYTVSYKKNKKKGTATLKVTGKGNFKGAVSLDFIIE